jgi:hypothetical protein
MTREQCRKDAVDLARELRNRGLIALSAGLMKRIDDDLTTDARATASGDAQSIELDRVTHSALLRYVYDCAKTMRDIDEVFPGRTDEHIYAHGSKLTPDQAVKLAARLMVLADEIEQKQRDRMVAIELKPMFARANDPH